jgi:hypothetical protein
MPLIGVMMKVILLSILANLASMMRKIRCGNGWNMVDQIGSWFLMRRMKTVTFLIPSQLVRDQIDPKDLQTATGDDCISDWAQRNVGSSHIGKRLFQSGPK